MISETIERVGEDRLRVDFLADCDEVDRAWSDAEAAVAELKRRPLGERQLGGDPAETERNAVATRATRALAEAAIRTAVERNHLRLSSPPKADIDTLARPGHPFAFSIELDVVPELELGDIAGISVEVRQKAPVRAEDVDARLDDIRLRAGKVEGDSEKPISEHDVVELSFESSIDGKAYEGSSAEGFSYTLGSHLLPEAFEQGLIGLRTGDEKVIEFTVPSDFENGDIAGKAARFEVKVGRVASRELPDADDAFAQSFGYPDIASWRVKIASELERAQEAAYQLRREEAARKALAERLAGEVDGGLIDGQAERMLQAFKLDLSNQGIPFDEYCSHLGLTEASIREEMRQESAAMVRENLALESLFRMLGLAVSPSELQETIAQVAFDAGTEAPRLEDMSVEQRAAVHEMTMHRMATEWLLEHAAFVDV